MIRRPARCEDLLRQVLLCRPEDVNDAARLSQDPTFRLIGSHKIWERGAALTSTFDCAIGADFRRSAYG
jgi:hypothetical protein